MKKKQKPEIVYNAIKNYLYSLILGYARKSIVKYANLQLACSKEAGEWLFGNTQSIVLNNGIDVSKYVFNQILINQSER